MATRARRRQHPPHGRHRLREVDPGRRGHHALLPANTINYNKAAGADTRERSLASYVLGHHRSERIESTGSSRPVGLRDHRHHSVILGVFGNEGLAATMTLAQVFWMPNTSQGQPNRFFVTADRALSIAADFADFDGQIPLLKRRLRADGAALSDHFPEYGTRARRGLGISSEQALELLHQTISMKSVGNLTDFVRQHMLEAADARPKIDSLIKHFDDLARSHAAVRKARDQLDQLTPLLALCDQHDTLTSRIDDLRLTREALRSWMAGRRLELLAVQADELRQAAAAADADVGVARAEVERRTRERGALERARDDAGGARLAQIEEQVSREERDRADRQRRASDFDALVAAAGLAPVTDETTYSVFASATASERAMLRERSAELDNERSVLAVDTQRAKDESDRVGAEIRSLRGQASNIDSRSRLIRDELARALDLTPGDLPFAGELIQVRPEHAAWQGAAERVLRGFALSILVPTEHYPRAAAWIDSRHLGGRIVYFRVAPRLLREPPALAPEEVLADLLEVKAGPFTAWMDRELTRRANHVCVETVAQLQQHDNAVTMAGQVRSRERHEKDDRFRVDDRTRWVLGWSNEDKVAALMRVAGEAQQRLNDVAARGKTLSEASGELVNRTSILDKVSVYQRWTDLDWRASVAQIGRLEEEARALREGNDQLAEIACRLDAVDVELRVAGDELSRLTREQGGLKVRLEGNEQQQEQARTVLATMDVANRERLATAYVLVETLGERPTDLAGCDRLEPEWDRRLTGEAETSVDQRDQVGQRAVRGMQEFRRTWAEDTAEMDADMAAASEYRALHDRVLGDDLPRFEEEFKRQLNTNTINEIAAFQAWLNKSATLIGERIDVINDSLRAIEYNPGRFITLQRERTTHEEVRAFREALRDCTDDIVRDYEQYSEERFLQVQKIIERFRGREGTTEADRRWTSTVIDVRNWFVFAASERWRETDTEFEHYTDSDGKSGGQKEKLAYTILAASLAYQFGLTWGAATSRDFRFAVIDEAFGRGSDASTRYALDLFRKLGLQLLIVTPLQKVHVIEPYVRAVGFVDNRTGASSRVQTLTIEEYHARRSAHLGHGAQPPTEDGGPDASNPDAAGDR